jgi:hypothetical protein
MSHIFISFATSNSDFVQELVEECRKREHEYWVFSERLLGGDDWKAEIDDAIESCRAMIVVMSPAAKASEYVTYEWAFAIGTGKRVIPIIIEETKLHPVIEGKQTLNFINGKRDWIGLSNAIELEASGSTTIRVPRTTKQPIKDAVKLLDSAKESDRDEGIKTLAEYGRNDPVALNALEAAIIKHSIHKIRLEAAAHLVDLDALSYLRSQEAISFMISILNAGFHSPTIRGKAASILGKLQNPPPQAIEALVKGLSSGSIADACASALVELEHVHCFGSLLVTPTVSFPTKLRIFQLICEKDTQETVEILRQSFIPMYAQVLPNVEDVEYARLEALGRSKNPLSLDILIEDLKNSESRNQLLKIYSSLTLKGGVALPRLIEELKHGKSKHRSRLLFIIGEIGDKSALEALREMSNAGIADAQLYNAIDKINKKSQSIPSK